MSRKHTAMDIDWSRKFGYRLKRLIHIKGMTQGQVARELGVTEATLSGYITGTHLPNVQIAAKLAYVLDVNIDKLFDESF